MRESVFCICEKQGYRSVSQAEKQYASGKHVHEKYTPLNPTFIQKKRGLKEYGTL